MCDINNTSRTTRPGVPTPQNGNVAWPSLTTKLQLASDSVKYVDLCHLCKSIVLLISPKKERFQHRPLREILQSSRQGCSFCTMIVVGFEYFRLLSERPGWIDLMI